MLGEDLAETVKVRFLHWAAELHCYRGVDLEEVGRMVIDRLFELV